jgi:putative transcriptional regulator
MDSLRDYFLISMPHLTDTFFEKSVIYVCEHDAQGAMGLLVNRPLGSAKVASILEALGIGSEEKQIHFRDVFFGGPVQPNLGFVLHTSEYEIDGTVHVSEAVSLTTNIDIVRDIKKGQGPARFRFTLGYAGWGPEQLDREIANGDWLVIPADLEFIFEKPDQTKWKDAARQFGIEITQMSGSGGLA